MKIVQIILMVYLMMSIPGVGKAMRCGTDLVTEGDRMYQVMKKCGEPSAEFAYSSPMVKNKLDIFAGENKVVIWTYDNKSASGMIHRLRFHDGVLTRISSVRH